MKVRSALTAPVNDALTVPGAPPLPGLRFRRFRGPEDYPGMVTSNMAMRAAFAVSDTVTLDGLANQYAHLANSEIVTDLILVEQDGDVVGYARVAWRDQQDGSRAYDTISLLRPELLGRGIEDAMLDWGEARLRAIAQHHEADRPRWYQFDNFDRNLAFQALIEARGYVLARRAHDMLRPHLDDLPDVPMPEGLEVRPVGRGDLRAVFAADAESFQDHLWEIEDSEEDFQRFANDPTTNPELFVVAFDGDDIAGLVLNHLDPGDAAQHGTVRGLIGSVAVRRPWRRRGLARALLAHSFRVLRDRGATCAFLGVDTENPNQALYLYESLGFEVVSSETSWRRPLDLEAP